jgi:hypothetical protein
VEVTATSAPALGPLAASPYAGGVVAGGVLALRSAGGGVVAAVGGSLAGPGAITDAQIVPLTFGWDFTSAANIAAAGAAFLAARTCAVDAAASALEGKLVCAAPPLPNGAYTLLAATSAGARVMLPQGQSISAALAVTGVSPAAGSIGGNTLVTLTGTGARCAPPSVPPTHPQKPLVPLLGN